MSELMDWILIFGKRIYAVQLQVEQMESVFQRQRRQKMLKKWIKTDTSLSTYFPIPCRQRVRKAHAVCVCIEALKKCKIRMSFMA